MDDDFLNISALQHYAYCPRQFALIHVEQVWEENRYTAEGRLLHERVDSQDAEQRGSVRYERSVLIKSEQHRIQGKMDLLEIHKSKGILTFFPVEYKRGKPKLEHWDRLQLCAQALCIEEMRQTKITQGAIWYWEVRKREPVLIDAALRRETIKIIREAASVRLSGTTPKPINNKRCQACSLYSLCEPNSFTQDWSKQYIAMMGE